MSEYVICVAGCDDATGVLMELSDAELATVQRVADAIESLNAYTCTPSMRVAPANQAPPWWLTDDDEQAERREAMRGGGAVL